jgi:hypothetical protein
MDEIYDFVRAQHGGYGRKHIRNTTVSIARNMRGDGKELEALRYELLCRVLCVYDGKCMGRHTKKLGKTNT